MKTDQTKDGHQTRMAAPLKQGRILDERQAPTAANKRSYALANRIRWLEWAPFLAVMLLGAVLRFWQLGDRPLHHDESLHAYYSMHLMWDMEHWANCFHGGCYHYDPLLHGPFQFHAIAFIYKICQLLDVYDHGVNTVTVRIAAATLGTVIVGLPYFLRDYLGKLGSWLAALLLAVSPSMVYFARFAREDTYMACFTLLLIVGIARYIRDHKAYWLVLASLGLALSYATKEATFLTIAILASFLGAVIAWEIGLRWQARAAQAPQGRHSRLIVEHGPLTALGIYILLLAPVAKIAFTWMKDISVYLSNPGNRQIADDYVKGLKEHTVELLPLLAIALVFWVGLCLLRKPQTGSNKRRRGKKTHIYAAMQSQPVVTTLLNMPWTHWLYALLAGWTVFMLLFTVLFTNFVGGLGDGIWQGLYYWLQQQQVARGGQPWYYYLILIPLYEQVGLVFGGIGIVYCLLRPSRFRLFLVYWCLGSLFIYSWAGEKMPWLTIHIMMPMLLLAGLGLAPAIRAFFYLVRRRLVDPIAQEERATGRRANKISGSIALATCILAVLLLIVTLQNMVQLNYVHAADGPHEMMVYVQTTRDVHLVMAKIDELDQRLYNGKRLLSIGLTNEATWPFVWYLRDYTNICLNFPNGCGNKARTVQVILAAGNHLETTRMQYAESRQGQVGDFLFHRYAMRSWWNEGYKPPSCVATPTHSCGDSQAWGGVGPWLWLSYGDNPPANAQFNIVLASQRIWRWWWQRIPFGSTDGAFNVGLLIRSNLGIYP